MVETVYEIVVNGETVRITKEDFDKWQHDYVCLGTGYLEIANGWAVHFPLAKVQEV